MRAELRVQPREVRIAARDRDAPPAQRLAPCRAAPCARWFEAHLRGVAEHGVGRKRAARPACTAAAPPPRCPPAQAAVREGRWSPQPAQASGGWGRRGGGGGGGGGGRGGGGGGASAPSGAPLGGGFGVAEATHAHGRRVPEVRQGPVLGRAATAHRPPTRAAMVAPLQPVEGRLAQLAEAVAMLVAGAARHRGRRARQLDDAAVAHALRQRAASELGRQHDGLLGRTCIAAHGATRAAVMPPTQSVKARLAELALRRVRLPVLMLPAPVGRLLGPVGRLLGERRHLQCRRRLLRPSTEKALPLARLASS
eukprot:scaffold109595_cov39-Phaeocystis_antarctica.AAC.1